MDMILLNGNVITMGALAKREQAVAIHNGLIAEVGTDFVVEQLKTRHTEVVDLKGRTVLPGFIDSHVHALLTGISLTAARLETATSVAEVCSRIHAVAKRTPADKWVYGFGFEPVAVAEGRFPTMAELDEVSEGRPVYVCAGSFHSGVANSLGFAAIAPDPRLPGVEKDPDSGLRTGAFMDDGTHFAAARVAFEGLTGPELEGLYQRVAALAASRGVTTLHCLDGQFMEGDRDVMALLDMEGSLPVHTHVMYQTRDVQRVLDLGLPRIGGCLTIDGAGFERTALFYDPYEGTEDVYGDLYIPEDELNAFVLEAHCAGLQIGLHAIGDRAVDLAVKAYGNAMERHPRADCRHRIEHFYVPTDWAIAEARRLGLALMMQPAFSYTCDVPGQSYYEMLWGRERADRAEPFPRLCRQGSIVAGGSDSPVTDIHPLMGVHAAVNNPNPVRRVTVEEALRMFTVNGAWAGHGEDRTGTLAVRMAADLVVLDRDPFMEPESIGDFSVELTICGGQVTFTAPA